MQKTEFSLIPFHAATAPEIEVKGMISRYHNQLQIEYQLTGKLSQVIIPALHSIATRQYNLWETTCLELFLRPQNTTQYWEFNLSPSGDWNVFRFPSYRQDIREELAYNALPFKVSHTPVRLNLDLAVDLNPIIAPEENIDVAITAVIENYQQQLSYWGLIHLSTEADFHHQESFVLLLKPHN